MTVTDIGTVVITGPTRGLGLAAARSLAARPPATRPDVVLVGRPGQPLEAVGSLVRSGGATAVEVPCDLGSLASVSRAAVAIRDEITAGRVRSLSAIVANAARQTTDIRERSTDGYELTFAVGHLAHFLLIDELRDVLLPGGRIVLVGSGTHRGGAFQRRLQVPDPRWEDPDLLATPGRGDDADKPEAARRAYSTSKLAVLYFAHELQRRLGKKAGVAVFDPGLMPGTGLVRGGSAGTRLAWHTVMKAMRVMPGVTSPAASGRVLADLAIDPRWAGLRDGAYVELTRVVDPAPHAFDPERERQLWAASERLVKPFRRVPATD